MSDRSELRKLVETIWSGKGSTKRPGGHEYDAKVRRYVAKQDGDVSAALEMAKRIANGTEEDPDGPWPAIIAEGFEDPTDAITGHARMEALGRLKDGCPDLTYEQHLMALSEALKS